MVQCDDCGHIYDVKANTKNVNLEPDIEIMLIVCPACGKEIEAYRTNGEIRTLQKEVQKERERVNHLIRLGTHPKTAERKVRKLLRTLKEKMETFNARS
jgi:DNA-directed RNA polymerase subunit M/transcription elongation factor TFIIS